jgi:hypothetical protein
MTKQQTGWMALSTKQAQAARTARNQLIARLKRERVYDEWTGAELLARQRDLRAQMYARLSTKET